MMGFFDKMLGREGNDSTVTDFQSATAASAPVPVGSDPGQLGQATGASFQMVVEDVFTITGRGTVVTGTIGSGAVSVGDRVTVVTVGGPVVSAVTGIEMFRKQVTTAGSGMNVGLLLDGVRRDDIARGTVISR
ncbi:MAG: EF-Tu/IF-2/RF-3 family GTPase [Rhodoglobus sp.]